MSVAIYPGSFDPVTFGHLAIIRRAARLFDHVRVLVAHNPEKCGLFSPQERVELLSAVTADYPQVTIDVTDGYVVDYARQIGAQCLIRGLRGADDARAETHLAALNRNLAPELETLLLPAESDLVAVSSSDLKARAQRGEALTALCPEPVARELRVRFGKDALA